MAGFEGGSFQKLFKGYLFGFLGHLVGLCILELNARETNLMKKRSVNFRAARPPWGFLHQRFSIYSFFLAVLYTSVDSGIQHGEPAPQKT